MHFFTQAAPVPACFAPHIESEIQPLIEVESAARAAIHANDKTTTSKATTRFTLNLQGNCVLTSAFHHAPLPHTSTRPNPFVIFTKSRALAGGSADAPA